MKDCYIGSNILELQHLRDYANENNIPGLLVCIDFEKAFDTIEWEFLFKSLEYLKFLRNTYKFDQDILQWLYIHSFEKWKIC